MIFTYAILLIIGPLLFLADLFVGISLVINVIGALRLVPRGVDTTGRVILADPREPGSSEKATVVYETPGGKFYTKGISKRRLHLGDPMPVRYHPDKPALATTVLSPWRRTFVGIPTVLAIMAMSLGMVISSAWYFGGTHTSLQLPLAGASSMGVLAVASVYGAAIQYVVLWRWRSRVQVDGKVLRFDENSQVGPGILVSFESADGPEEFWERAGTVNIGSSDEVTVYYDPDKPATSASLRDAYAVRTLAIWWTTCTLFTAPLTIFSLTLL